MDRSSSQAAGPSAMAVDAMRPMSRPGYGRAGKPIKLETNFFPMQIPRSLTVSQYAISIWRYKHPEDVGPQARKSRPRSRPSSSTARSDKKLFEVSASEPIFFNRAVFALVCRQHGSSFGCSLAYDGRSIAYAARELNRSCLGTMYSVTVDREGHPPTSQDLADGKVEEVKVKIEHAKYLKFDDILQSRVGTIASAEYLAALDVVIATTPLGKYVQIGRSFYSPDNCRPLGKRDSIASAWRGFYQSARLSQLGLVVNLDESFTAFWDGGGRPLADLVQKANGGRELRCDDSRGLREMSTKLKALKVRAQHTRITYRVHGFSSKGANHIMFDSATHGRRVSITEYFMDTYNIRLRHGNQPCVKTNPKRDTYLPMEVLVVMESQRLTGTLSQDQTSSIVKVASGKPDSRRAAALRTMQRLDHSHDSVCRDFGVKVSSNLITVDARILPTPGIEYSDRRVIKPSQGAWRVNRETFVTGSPLASWAVINACPRLPLEKVQSFVTAVARSAQKNGMTVYNTQPHIYTCRPDRISDEMRSVAARFSKDKRLQVRQFPLQLIMIIKEKQDTPMYNAIKRTGDLELGIASQCCLEKHVGNDRGGRSREMYCDNLILKINSKLGGQNAAVRGYGADPSSRIPDVPFVNVPHIVLGADVTHPMVGGKSPSVAALVGSRDRQGIQYTGAIRNQPGRQEVIGEIGEMFKEVYSRWRANFGNKHHAASIIMFRDGVSDGQFEEVMQIELEALRRSCRNYNPPFNPRITYIIVTKRHHARFFGDKNNIDRSGNILPGTVIDQGITSREFYDFYLNSHAGIQGTSKPSKYTVLVDENKIPVDALQGYIFRLAHGFVRCNRSVSMVNSAYYAHLLAFRGRSYLNEEFSDSASTASGDSSVQPAAKVATYLAQRLFFV